MRVFKINGVWVLVNGSNFLCSLLYMDKQPTKESVASRLLFERYEGRKLKNK